MLYLRVGQVACVLSVRAATLGLILASKVVFQGLVARLRLPNSLLRGGKDE